jgi:hypothetical protein
VVDRANTKHDGGSTGYDPHAEDGSTDGLRDTAAVEEVIAIDEVAIDHGFGVSK